MLVPGWNGWKKRTKDLNMVQMLQCSVESENILGIDKICSWLLRQLALSLC